MRRRGTSAFRATLSCHRDWFVLPRVTTRAHLARTKPEQRPGT
jgi:hypothetical protein